MRNRINRTFILQYSSNYCGVACLASIVKYYGGDVSQNKLSILSGTTKQGTSLLGLCQCATKVGFEAEGYEADIVNLKTLNEPVILHLLLHDNRQHYVVCYGFKNDKFIIGDPGLGIVSYSENELDNCWKSKSLLLLTPTEDFISNKEQKVLTRKWLKELIKEDIVELFIAAFLGIIISVLSLAVAIYTQKLIDEILPQNDRGILFKSLGILLFILFVKILVTYVRGIIIVKQSRDLNIRAISTFFNRLLFSPICFFDHLSTGDMVSRLNDTQRIQKFIVKLLSGILVDVLIVISSLVYIFYISSTTGIVSLIALPVFTVLVVWFNKKVIKGHKEVMQSYAATESKYIDTIQGVSVIKSYNKENLFHGMINSFYGAFQKRLFDFGILNNNVNIIIQLFSVLFIIGITGWTAFQVLEGQMMLGHMVGIMTILGSMLTSVMNTAMANIQFQEAKVAFKRMLEFLDEKFNENEYELKNPSLKIDLISINNLSFRYPGKGLILTNIFVEFKIGKVYALIGDVGSGKSTLISILQRFYPIDSGAIMINSNINWNTLNDVSWRSYTGYVSQKVKLFKGSIIENISLEEKPNSERIIEFCRKLGFDKYFQKLDQGYNTFIQENGSNLSGGQLQLLALARALYRNPQILLLDEATSAMDETVVEFVMNLLKDLKEKMIIVFITHQMNIANKCDEIYKIENKHIFNDKIDSDQKFRFEQVFGSYKS